MLNFETADVGDSGLCGNRDIDGVLGGVIVGPTELARDEDARHDVSNVEGDIIDHPNNAVRMALSEGSLSSWTGELGREAEPSSPRHDANGELKDNDAIIELRDWSCFVVYRLVSERIAISSGGH